MKQHANLPHIFRVVLFTLFTIGLSQIRAADEPLKLGKGDKIAIIGNTLADRMQHFGWLETLVHAKFPEHDLVFRNLAAAGDEIVTRHRSENFGSPDEWLKKAQADVIFAFFGYNESFKGPQGVDQFKAQLDKFLKETATKNYSGKGTPKIVLFSPIANEKHQDPNFPDPAKNNANIKLYTAAMAEIAKANNVQFVDLYATSEKLYSDAAGKGVSLTINGLHLSEMADKIFAPVIFQSIFGEAAPAGDFEKLRTVVNDKNWQFHQRYRTVDGYNVYGGRSKLPFPNGKGGPIVTNFMVMQQEMAQRDVLTANRDKLVWATAQGKEYKVDDSNLPPVTVMKTNKVGSNPDESHPFPTGEGMIAKIKTAPGLKINLFASEEDFPDLIKPVQMMWDAKGRLWVCCWRNYPETTPTTLKGDSVLIFEDTNGDGKADKVTPFLENLNCPTGFQFHKDGILLMQAPDLWFCRDTNGDGKADTKERVLMGMDSADSHHTTNAMCYEPGGGVYLSDGVFHRTQVETANGPVRNNDAAIYRFEPMSGKFETYASYGFANPHGRVFDAWGNDIITDATGNANYFGAAMSGYLEYPAKHKGMNQFWARPSRPCPATGIVTSRHFPEDWQGNFLNFNVISFQGIYRVKVRDEGSGIAGTSLPDVLSSTDPTFRPICMAMGRDGALYFADWSNAIIGHMQHHLRDPNRDQKHGRIYRVTYEGRPLMTPPKIAGEPIEALLPLLKEPENETRELTKIELGKHEPAKVVAAVKKWLATLDKSDKNYEHQRMEALWVHQWQNVVDIELLKEVLKSPDFRARAQAVRVMCYWRDRVPEAATLLKAMANDESPRVRLEVVRSASFFRDADGVDMVIAIKNHPMDYYLEYTTGETIRALDVPWKQAIASGKVGGAAGGLSSISAADLLKMPRTAATMQAILMRADIVDATRNEVLNAIAAQMKSNRTGVLLGMLEGAAKSDLAGSATLARMLPAQPPADLKAASARLMKLAASSPSADVRQPAWASIATGDESFDAIWAEGEKSAAKLTDVLGAVPYVFDPAMRSKIYDKVKPLVTQAPADLVNSSKPMAGRFVRIELPNKGTLTLAEVQVFSEGQNIALKGKAKQSTTAHGGAAGRAIDGNTDGTYAKDGQTHTAEDAENPWWELDLGGAKPIESIVIWNRTDGEGRYVSRMEGFTLTVLDAKRQEIFKKAGNPAPKENVKIALGAGDVAGNLQRAAIRAAVSINKEQAATFAALAGLIDKGELVTAAAKGLRTLPRKTWPAASAGVAANGLVNWAKKVPVADRTSQEYIEVIQVATDLAGLTPAAQATGLRKELSTLRVAVFVINTVREQMRYDTPRIVVEAGKQFEIIMENTDFMPHNLVVIKPGKREAIGTAAGEMTPDQVDGRGRPYIPKGGDVLAATKLLEAGQKTTLSMTAPMVEGNYEYVCTFPGHWELMWGTLVVTKDVEAYLQANPEGPKAGEGAANHDHANHK